MRPYLAILSARFRLLLQYRAAAVAGFVCQLFFGLVIVMSLEAFYGSVNSPQPIDLPQVITYVWLGQAFLGLLPWRGDGEIEAAILTGNVAYELLRPVDLYAMWYARALALRVAPTLLRCLPMLIVAMLVLEMRPPASLAAAAAFVAAIAAASLLAASISVLMMLPMLWTLSGRGVNSIVSAVVNIFSGIIIPLPLLPEGLRRIVELLPFAGLMDLPFRLYVGNIPPRHAAGVLALQLGWTAVLVLLGRWVLARGTRRMVVQGG